jgi:hypothetical protein
MTDAAVIADSAPAPVEGAPIDGAGFAPQPLGSQVPPEAQAKPEAAKTPSVEDSIDRAMAKSAEAAKAPKVEAKADVKAQPEAKEPAKLEQPRENGKFAPKDSVKAPAADSAVAVDASKPVEQAKPSHTAEDAPARFTETAKAKWASADPEIRGEVRRMEKELTDGYQKHRQAAERDGEIADFHEMATKHGTTVKEALTKYTNMENLLRQDVVKGLSAICENAGVSLKDVAAHVLNQTPDQQASQSDATIRELKAELASLKEQVGGVTQTFQQQREQSTLTEINKFAEQNPRFEELAEDIAFFMKSGRAKDLPEAYSLAERLNPAQAAAAVVPAASSAAPPIPEAHTLAGQKSINGAPSAGLTSPGRKRAALSLDDALNKAFGHAG